LRYTIYKRESAASQLIRIISVSAIPFLFSLIVTDFLRKGDLPGFVSGSHTFYEFWMQAKHCPSPWDDPLWISVL
jgi:hypothetical protein